jgi:SAM-dependent methyltransferase
MDFRKIFDTIPEDFDKWRPRYCNELFEDVIKYSKLDSSKTALEIGPGTGQATEPILKTGCSYLAIELGEHLTEFMKNRFGSYKNVQIINADFETYNFGIYKYDLVYSAATMPWIPEKTGFPKVYDILQPYGTFAMMMTESEYRSTNEDLYYKIQEVYKKYFRPENEYRCRLSYENIINYGFIEFENHKYKKSRSFNADEYVSYIGTHCDHLSTPETYRLKLFGGIRNEILKAGNQILLNDTIVLYLTRKQ